MGRGKGRGRSKTNPTIHLLRVRPPVGGEITHFSLEKEGQRRPERREERRVAGSVYRTNSLGEKNAQKQTGQKKQICPACLA